MDSGSGKTQDFLVWRWQQIWKANVFVEHIDVFQSSDILTPIASIVKQYMEIWQ
jgi:hypothetical protein